MKMTSERIKALREARGWTQAELARRLSITRNGVNSWEQGLSMPSPACLVGEAVFCLNRLSVGCGAVGDGQCHGLE